MTMSRTNRMCRLLCGALALLYLSPASPAQGAAGLIEEIIVTAQKREESLQA